MLPLSTRRAFLASLGATAAAHLSPWTSATPPASTAGAGEQATGTQEAQSEYLLAPGLTYLNTATLGPTPRIVLDRTIEAWRQIELNPGPVSYNEGAFHVATDRVRERAAAFLGCAADDLSITRSTTDAMNAIALGIRFESGDRVLTTDQEHDGGIAGWQYLARRSGVAIDVVPIAPTDHDPEAILDRFAAAITPRTRVISVSHVITSTGLRMPVTRLSELARSRGTLCVVDGAQAVGHIPVNLRTIGCHAYAISGHKWLMGPKGTGLLYISPNAREAIEPLDRQDGPRFVTHATGMGSLPLAIGMGTAIERLENTGMGRVEGRVLELRHRAFTGLQGMRPVRVVSAPPGPMATGMVAFILPDSIDSRALQTTLRDKHNILIKMVEKRWFNGNRISPHIFNSEEDVDRVLRALRAELA